jgi:hypothetical protein
MMVLQEDLVVVVLVIILAGTGRNWKYPTNITTTRK